MIEATKQRAVVAYCDCRRSRKRKCLVPPAFLIKSKTGPAYQVMCQGHKQIFENTYRGAQVDYLPYASELHESLAVQLALEESFEFAEMHGE